MHSNNIFQSDLLVYNKCNQVRNSLQASARVQSLSYTFPKPQFKQKQSPNEDKCYKVLRMP